MGGPGGGRQAVGGADRNVRRGGGAIVIFVLLMPTPRSGGPAGGAGLRVRGALAPPAPPHRTATGCNQLVNFI